MTKQKLKNCKFLYFQKWTYLRNGLYLRRKVNREKFAFIRLFLTVDLMMNHFLNFKKFVKEKIKTLDDYNYNKLMNNYGNRIKKFGTRIKLTHPNTTVSFMSVKNVIEKEVDQNFSEWYQWHLKFLSLLKNDLYPNTTLCSFDEWIRMNYGVKSLLRSLCGEYTKTLSNDYFKFLEELEETDKILYFKIIDTEVDNIENIIRIANSRINNHWYKWGNKKKPAVLQNGLSSLVCDQLMKFFE